MRRAALLILLVTLSASTPTQLTPAPDALYVRVVDVGPGLCVVAEIPGPYYLIYDGGHWLGNQCIEAVREIVDGEDIDVMVISHPDSDHLGQADTILAEYTVHQVWRTGFPRFGTASWEDMNDAVGEEAKTGTTVINLQTTSIAPGEGIQLGDATLSFLAGWGRWNGPAGPTGSELRNVISIVAKLEYAGSSVLFTGDTIGRRRGDPDNACKDAEAWMVNNVPAVLLDSDVIIAPHHGGDNGSSTCFVEAVSPEFVIFSAGSQHQHPTAGAAGRYIAAGVDPDNMLRTDRDDDEPGLFEWDGGRDHNATGRDGRGDDDVEIVINADGSLVVAYMR